MEKLPALLLLPLLLMPAIVALARHKRSRALICVLNVVLIPVVPFFVGLLFSFPTVNIATTKGLLSLAALLATWLALLHAAISKDAPTEQDLDEPVKLVDHDATWGDAFAAESRRLRDTLSLPPDAIEHIGSTAVPGLAAKPVIDMMLGVEHLERIHELLSRLEILGYQNLGEAGVPGRVYLRLRGGERDFNLHILERGGEHWTSNLALRALLRADPAARERYAAAKAQALAGTQTLLGYSAAKQPAITELLLQARPR